MFKKINLIFFLSLCIVSLSLFFACSENKTEKHLPKSYISYYNDFENDSLNSIWKNVSRINDSGNFVCECREDMKYAFGLNLPIDDTIGNRNALFYIDMKIKAEQKPDASFVFSVVRDNKSVFWHKFPLSENYKNDDWYEISSEINVPNDVLKNSKLNCYILNSNKNHFYIDDFNFAFELYNLPTYIDEIKEYGQPNKLREVTNTQTINILYSNRENKIVLADDKNNPISQPISMYYSLIVNDDTLYFQSADWKLLKNVNDDNVVRFINKNNITSTELTISYKDDNPNVNFSLESKFLKDIKIVKSSLIIPFINDDFTVYRRNPFVDSVNYQDVYYLDNEGFSLNLEDKQLNLYHPDDISSIQLDTRKSTAYINTDYFYDHLLIRFPLSDTVDYFIDNSTVFMKAGSVFNSSFTISLTDKTILPRIMPIFDGYESAIIWTEHADWSDIKTHRATYFGSEEVTNINDAVGGFAYYDIPVTKSVFYHNPDSINNYDKNNDYPGLHSTIMTDSLFFDFLKQLRDNDFDICLHTPEQYTSNRDYLSEALSFMKENFASPSWIDHGYNNGILSNREDMVCDGLDSASPYYVYDLWKENGVRFPWNASYEDVCPFENYLFDNNMLRPYPGFGDAFPLRRVISHPSYPDILMWSTSCTVEPGDNWAWNYYFSKERLNKIVDFREVFITHIYAPWVDESRGFWEMEDGKVVAKKGFNSALEKIADMRKQRLMLPTTVADFMKYQQQLKSLEYRVEENGDIILKNNNNETIKGLSLISTKEIKLDNLKSFNKRLTNTGDEYIIWFDMSPNEEVRVLSKIK